MSFALLSVLHYYELHITVSFTLLNITTSFTLLRALHYLTLIRVLHYLTLLKSFTAMVILPRGFKCKIPPNIYLSGAVIKYADSFQYVGHVISKDFTNNEDIARETRNLYIRGNTIVQKFVLFGCRY